MSADGSASARSARLPMAFTAEEFWRGAFSAWGCFVLADSLVATIFLVAADRLTVNPLSFALLVLIVGVFVGGLSMFVFLLGSPFAWFLGRVLRRVPWMPLHVLAFAVYGALVGGGVVRILWPDPTAVGGLPIATVIVSSAACAMGWWRASRRAHAENRAEVVETTS